MSSVRASRKFVSLGVWYGSGGGAVYEGSAGAESVSSFSRTMSPFHSMDMGSPVAVLYRPMCGSCGSYVGYIRGMPCTRIHSEGDDCSAASTRVKSSSIRVSGMPSTEMLNIEKDAPLMKRTRYALFARSLRACTRSCSEKSPLTV